MDHEQGRCVYSTRWVGIWVVLTRWGVTVLCAGVIACHGGSADEPGTRLSTLDTHDPWSELAGAQIFLSQAVLAEAREESRHGDRNLLHHWLGQQVIEGPYLDLQPLEEYLARVEETVLWEDVQQDGSVHLDAVVALYGRLLGLEVIFFDDPPRDGVASTPTRLGQVVGTDMFGALIGDDTALGDLVLTSGGLPPTKVLPLERRRYNKSDEFYAINPGRIGPNFLHTWAIDTLNVDKFWFGGKIVKQIRLWQSAIHGDDTVTVVDSCGTVLQTYREPSDFLSYPTDLSTKPTCKHDATNAPYTRLYITLETSKAPMPGAPRKFEIESLDLAVATTGSEHAYVVSDEINYDFFDTTIVPQNNNDFVEALDAKGAPFKLYPPWSGGLGGNGNRAVPPQLRDKPSAKKGWHLLGMNTTDTDPGFYSVVYYNEQTARLLAYLFNLDPASEHSAHLAKVYLEGCTSLRSEPGAGGKKTCVFTPLKGPIFPVDMNPKKWWRGQVAVPQWAPKTWTAVELPMLYPMASNLTGASETKAVGGNNSEGWTGQSAVGSSSPQINNYYKKVQRYRSVYEDQLAPGQKNVRLVVSVRSYDKGDVKLQVIGKAVGEAIAGKSSKLTLVHDAIVGGFDWFKAASKFGGEVGEFLNQQGDSKDKTIKEVVEGVGKAIEFTTTVMSTAMGVGGVTATLFKALTGGSASKMAVSLEISAQAEGNLSVLHVEREKRFYLPGRFSIKDAMTYDGIATDQIRTGIDSLLPRYDRTMGIFGYAFAPWETEINLESRLDEALVTQRNSDEPIQIRGDGFAFPAEIATSGPWVGKLAPRTTFVPNLLPVVVNPYAEIDVIPTKPLAQASDSCDYDLSRYPYLDTTVGAPTKSRCSEIYLTAADRADTKTVITCESGKACAPRKLDQTGEVLRTRVTHLEEPVLETSGIEPLQTRDYIDRRNLRVNTSYRAGYTQQRYESPVNWKLAAPTLIHDFMYYWTLRYMYVGDTRLPPGGVPTASARKTQLFTPMTMRLMEEHWDAGDRGTKVHPADPVTNRPLASALLTCQTQDKDCEYGSTK